MDREKNQQFYQGNFPVELSRLQQYDAIVLQNFTGKNMSPQVILSLKNGIESNQTPLLFIAGVGVDFQSLLPLQNFLPMALPANQTQEILVMPRLTARGVNHPVTQIVDDELATSRRLSPVGTSENSHDIHVEE